MAAKQTVFQVLAEVLNYRECEAQTVRNLQYNVYREASFTYINVYQWAKHGFASLTLSEKDSAWNGNTVTPRKR